MRVKLTSVRRARRLLVVTSLLVVLVVGGGIELVRQGDGAGAAEPAANSANRMLVWTSCLQLYQLKDADLDAWSARGTRAFACGIQRLPGMGATERFSGDLKAISGPGFGLERALSGSKIIQRAHDHGMKVYLSFYFANAENAATPLSEWFDDADWADTALPAVRDVAATAKALGFDGLAFDQELYSSPKVGSTATWSWEYPGNRHSEAETRAKVRQRGQELMRTILGAYPDVEILAYYTKFPQSWDEVVQDEINDDPDAYRDFVQVDLWNGMLSTEGYRRVTFLNATFYKSPHVGTWDTAYTYEFNSLFAFLSRNIDNWTYAASRVQETPFVWISPGSTPFESARAPSYVAEQLDAARRWGMGRMFADYGYGGFEGFDWGPYEDSLRTVSKPGVVDTTPPVLEVQQPPPVGTATIDLHGTARDDFAVRFVRWRNDRGDTGTAELTWDAGPGDPQNGWEAWKTEWAAKDVPLHPGTNVVKVTAEDTKGLRTVETVKVVR